MNKEFKKISGKNETRFVLEAGTGGATTAGNVATGVAVRKDNLLVQGKDDKPTVKPPPNPVATQVIRRPGAGAHVDRKDRDQRIRGQKHKKDWRRDVDEGVEEGFKNTYSVGDRVDSPLGTGTIVAISKNINVDGRVIVKLDDPSKAGEDGKYKDSFVLNTTQLKHIAEQGVAEGWPDYDDNQYSLTDSTGKELTLLRGNTPEEAIERAKQLIGSNEKLLATFGLVKLTPRPHYIVRNAKRQGVAEGYGIGAYATVAGAAPIAKHVPEASASNYSKLSELEALVRTAREIVHDIKYDEGYIDIVAKIEELAKKHNIDVRYEVDEVTQAKLRLNSAVYGLVEPFRDAVANEQDRIDNEELGQNESYLSELSAKLDEKIKGRDGKACWKGYRYAGTKKKGGKTVDNCVKVGESTVDEEKKKGGLWGQMWDRRKRGLPPRKPGTQGAPTKKNWDSAVAASKKKKKNITAKEENELAENPQFTSMEQVRDYFRKRGIPNPDAAARAAWERGWRGHVPPKKPAQSKKPEKPAKPEQGRLFQETNSNKYTNELFAQLNEKMMPARHFAGTPQNKLGPAAHLKGRMKRPAKQGDLVGGGAEESFQKKKDIEEKLNPTDPVDAWEKEFLSANPERYHQFRQNNRPGTRKDDAYITRMARRASYRAKMGK